MCRMDQLSQNKLICVPFFLLVQYSKMLHSHYSQRISINPQWILSHYFDRIRLRSIYHFVYTETDATIELWGRTAAKKERFNELFCCKILIRPKIIVISRMLLWRSGMKISMFPTNTRPKSMTSMVTIVMEFPAKWIIQIYLPVNRHGCAATQNVKWEILIFFWKFCVGKNQFGRIRVFCTEISFKKLICNSKSLVIPFVHIKICSLLFRINCFQHRWQKHRNTRTN